MEQSPCIGQKESHASRSTLTPLTILELANLRTDTAGVEGLAGIWSNPLQWVVVEVQQRKDAQQPHASLHPDGHLLLPAKYLHSACGL